jgi:hypothetical protein
LASLRSAETVQEGESTKTVMLVGVDWWRSDDTLWYQCGDKIAQIQVMVNLEAQKFDANVDMFVLS